MTDGHTLLRCLEFINTYFIYFFTDTTTIEDRNSAALASPLSPIIEATDNADEENDNDILDDPNDECQEPTKQQCSPGYIRSPYGVTIELLGQELWKKFYKLGTEMIITKAGR